MDYIDKEYEYNLLLHVDSDEVKTLDLALANAHNFIKALPDTTIRIVLVITGPAVKLMTPECADQARRGAELMEKGISIQVCRNALKAYRIDESRLWQGVLVVQDGIVELVTLQDEGMRYVKP